MKRLLFFVIALLVFTGCPKDRAAYNTIGGIQEASKLSYDAYIDGVIKDQIPTNDVPVVANAYDALQASLRVAIKKASGDTNAPITDDIKVVAERFADAVAKARKKPE